MSDDKNTVDYLKDLEQEIDALQARVRELEERLVDYDAAASECEGQSVLTTLRALKQYGMQLEREKADLEAKLRQVEQERDQLRARVGELEALNHKLNKALVFAEHGRTLERLQDSETQRALEGKEEHGTRRDE